MILFLDLDNTLIYSKRHSLPVKKKCVETLNGIPQAFMTEYAAHYFKTQKWLTVIPVTTRTKEQFVRLEGLMQYMGWTYALICNGALLLNGCKEVREWTTMSWCYLSEGADELQKLYIKVLRKFGSKHVVNGGDFLFYIKNINVPETASFLRLHTDNDKITIIDDGKQVFCMPKSNTKGAAVKRFMEYFPDEQSIAAGDSAFDISMIEAADIGLCPKAIAGCVKKDHLYISSKSIFSDDICDELEKIKEKIRDQKEESDDQQYGEKI